MWTGGNKRTGWAEFFHLLHEKHCQMFVRLFAYFNSLETNSEGDITTNMINTRCLMVSTNQADPSCFYFRISWILMERRWFYFFHPLHFLQGLRSLKHWLLQKLSMKIFDQTFRLEGTKKIKSTSFHQYSWNSEVETTWISLIGWHHKASNNSEYLLFA